MRRKMRSQSAWSSAWLWVMTRKYAPGGAWSTTASGVSEASASMFSGRPPGNSVSRSSTQCTRQGSVASTLTSAWPTWPAPNSTTCMSSGTSVSVQAPSGRSATDGSSARLGATVTGPAPEAGTDRSSARPLAKAASTASSQPRSSAPSTSKASCTTPPQHWPSEGPSGIRSMRRAAAPAPWVPSPAIMERAMSIPRHSRCPPPIVPTRSPAVTSMRMPGSRGAEPLTSTMVTIVTGTPARTQRAASAKRNGLSGASCMMTASGARRLHRFHGIEDGLARGRGAQRRVDAVVAHRRDGIADREEHRERQQQRRLAHGL
ncbi:hypothetical protein D3C81_1314860 [compost metagenome]